MGNDYDILVIPHSSIIVHTLSWSFENTISIKIVKWKHDFSIFIILTKIVFFHCKLVFVQSVQWRLCNNIGPILISHAPTPYHIWHNSQKEKKKAHSIYTCHSPMKAYHDNLVSCMTIHFKTIHVYIMLSTWFYFSNFFS